MGFPISSVEKWRKRMTRIRDEYALDQPLVMVVGSGLSFDRDGEGGVADVPTLIEWIREEGITIATGSIAEQYQQGMEALKEDVGPRAVSSLIRRAILKAYRGESELVAAAMGAPSDAQRSAGRLLDQEINDWVLPRGVYGLAGWLRSIVDARRRKPNPSIGPIHVVTTNFDPLMEVALKRFGGDVVAHSIPHDDNPLLASCQVCVWHVHGAWWDVTLHASEALKGHRNTLKQALLKWMRDSQICILGYGGWQDVVSTTIADTLSTFGGCPDILWAFFEDSDKEIWKKYRDPLELLTKKGTSAPAAGQVTLFGGVDVHAEFKTNIVAAPAPDSTTPAVSGIDLPPELLERLKSRLGELFAAAPAAARPDLEKWLTIKDKLPDLCVVLADLCLWLKPMEEPSARRRFAAAVLEAVSALAACVLNAGPDEGPREPAPTTANARVLTVDSVFMAELRMAADHQRAFRVKCAEVSVKPAYGLDGCALSGSLEQGPCVDDLKRAYQNDFWAMDFPHIPFDPAKHEADLLGHLRAKKLLREERFAVTRSNEPAEALQEKIPHARFFIRLASGATSTAIDERTLASLLRDLLELAPELSPTPTAKKGPLP